jgi:hypothetical protein
MAVRLLFYFSGVFKKYYGGLFYGEASFNRGCNPTINFLIREKIFSSDVIYIEGGSISRLMSNFKKYGVDKILEEAYKKEIVLAGKSAGAFCFGRYYFQSDDPKDFKIDGFSDLIFT